jgi:hypothetical protein
MKFSNKSLIVVVAMLAITVLAAACSSAKAAAVTTSPTASVPVRQVQFKATNLAVNPAQVNAGVQALITANITNLSDTDLKYDGRVEIDSVNNAALPGILAPGAVSIPAGTSKLVSVATVINYPGTYRVKWEDSSSQIVVNPADPSQANVPPVGGYGAASDFSAVDVVTGKKVSLSQFKGSAVLLNFVNYGCNPSLNDKVDAQLQAIKQLSQQRPDFVPLSVFCGCCSPDVLRQFAKQNSFNWPWVLDTDYSIAPKYSQFLTRYSYPTLVFIDANQNIIDVAGYTDISGLSSKINEITAIQSK